MTIVEFLEARIAEDEAVARAIDDKQMDSGWSVSYNPYGLANTPPGWYITPHIGLAYEAEGGAHIARFNPARVLRECAAKRRIVERYAYIHSLHWDSAAVRSTEEVGFRYMEGQIAVQALASAYSDHLDYQEDWDR